MVWSLWVSTSRPQVGLPSLTRAALGGTRDDWAVLCLASEGYIMVCSKPFVLGSLAGAENCYRATAVS
jgi:hypothetical protein